MAETQMNKEANNPKAQALLEKHRGAIEQSIAAHPGWPRTDYELSLVRDWDHTLVPLVAALPKRPIAWSPIAALSETSFVSNFAPNAFEAVLKQHPGLSQRASTAQMLRLIGYFLDMHAPTGTPRPVLNTFLQARFAWSRKDMSVVRKTTGASERFEFASYNDEADEAFECVVEITANTAKAECKPVSRKAEVAK